MFKLRQLILGACVSLIVVATAFGQIIRRPPGEISLTAKQSHAVVAPPNSSSTLIGFQVDVGGRSDELFDVVIGDAGASVSLILPDATEVTSQNAASLGFAYDIFAEDHPVVTDRLLISLFAVRAKHAIIRLPASAPSGTYFVKVNNTGIVTETPVFATYISTSPIRMAATTNATSYRVGDQVVISAFLFNGQNPVNNATVTAVVGNEEHPELSPVQITLQDSGSLDAAQGDGIYTGVYTPTAGGKYSASIRASGTSANGSAYGRASSTSFEVQPPLASFVSFADAGMDDNSNGLFDRVVVTATANVQQAGNYRFEISLVAGNGAETTAANVATLATGSQAISASFTAAQLIDLGVDGPYAMKNATLVYLGDPEERLTAFLANAGQTSAYQLSALERPALRFTGNNVVTGVDTNTNGKFDVLRIQVEVNVLTAATYNWSGTLKDATGKDIQAIDGASSMSAGNNIITFDFDGIKIAQHGVDGPYVLSSVLVFNNTVAIHESELLRTPAFSVNEFECSDAPAATVQSVALTPSTLVGGNATTLHVTLAQPAGTCGAKVTLSSDNPAVVAAAIPATMIVPAGQNSADFTVIIAGVATATQVNLTATSGASSQSAALNVTPSSLSNLSLSFTALQAGANTAAKVQLDGAAPLGGLTVSLLSNNPTVAPVPGSVVIPAGQMSVEFVVNTNPTFQGSAVVNISATLAAVTKVATLTVYSETFINGTISAGGSPVTVTAAEAGQNFLLTFDGTADQRVSLEITGVTIGTSSCCGALVSIKKPDGSYLVTPTSVGTAGAFIDVTVLPVTGSYTILVDPVGANTGSLTLNLYDVPADASGTITPGGPPVSTSVTVRGQNARLTFDGTAGQRVSLKISGLTMTGGNGYVDVHLKKPDGAILASATYILSTGFIDVQTLPASGTYTILVDPQGTNTGAVTLKLYDVPPDVTGNIAVGTPLTVTMGVPGQNAQLSFNGVAGQRITLNIGAVSLTGGNGYVDVYIKKPDGTNLASAVFVSTGGAFINTQILPVTGTYTILVNPQEWNTGSLTLSLNDVSADVIGTLVIGGSSTTVTTTSAGQNAQVTFDANAGQRVSLWISGVTMSGGNGYVDVYLKRPDGSIASSAVFVSASGGFIDALTLPVTGTYTILVDPQGSNIGSVTLTLYDVPADVAGPIVPGGPSVTVTTTAPGQNAILTFSGTAGQRVSLVVSNSTFSGCLAVTNTIKNPDGTTLTWINLCSSAGFIDTVTLPVTGTYTIVIDPQGLTIGNQTLLLVDVPPDVTSSITPGGPPVTLTTTVRGQNGRATFAGTSNQRISLNVTGVSLTGGSVNWVSLSVKNPDGTTLTSSIFNVSGGFIDVQTLPATGTYTILVDPWDSSTGSVTLTLYDVPADVSVSITPNSTPVTITNTTPGQNGRATFTATANQRVSLNVDAVNLTGGYHNWVGVSILKPDGTTLTSGTYSSGGAFFDVQTLATAGTYTILVDPWDTATGSVTFTTHDVPPDVTGTIIVGGSPLTLTTTVPGQNAIPTFSGTSGQQVSIALSNNSMGTVTVTLLKPDGTSVTSAISAASSFTLSTQELPVTGSYSLKIDPSGANVGSITASVSQVSNSGTLQADYQFQNTRNSSVGSPPALSDLGTNSFTSATVDGTSTTVLTFSQNNGLSLSPTTGVLANDSYTIVMLFSISQTSGYRRIADFKNGTSDNGLYAQNGRLYFYPAASGSGVSIAANTYVQVVITRDTTGTVTGYVDGVQQFQFSDVINYGVITSNTLRFFRDDNSASEASPGSVARIRIYNGALTSSQVSALSRLP